MEELENVFKPSVKLKDMNDDVVLIEVMAFAGKAAATVNDPVMRQTGGHWYPLNSVNGFPV